ncbi:LysR family transcriptional regulator [Nannocystis radixulma]|uniref:LysR family transcriptional regulator n=1 Tax=Nannocystis radixulma TaxID=2995305 RepID=A0ABT5BEG6_9BACT|nr:LysR family transcriptional regulator [Nannocystis radixulma]MDC0672462.1 LysR family transcriptional regulator [Nannocystis radixulma]
MDRLEAMAAFVAVADLRGFAPAARKLGLSPSAVTRLVAGLEERLTTRLLQRTTRSVSLTDAGARYLERARRILHDLDEAEAAAQAEHSEPTGRLVVAASNLFGRLAVAPVLSDYLARHPGVIAELTLSDRIVNLVEDGIDVAVRISELSDSSLHARRVGATRRVVVAAPSYLARRPPPRTPDELAEHAVVQFTGLHPAPEWRFVVGGRPLALTLHPVLATNSADAAIGHAERGGGLTMALAYQVADAVRAGRLAVVLAEFEPPPQPIYLVYPSARLVPAKVRAFVDLVLETCDWNFVAL